MMSNPLSYVSRRELRITSAMANPLQSMLISDDFQRETKRTINIFNDFFFIYGCHYVRVFANIADFMMILGVIRGLCRVDFEVKT